MDETMGDQQEVSKPNESELAWLAGMFNGDGCFSITVRKRNKVLKCDLSLTLTQGDPALIEKTADILSRLGINAHIAEYQPTGAGKRTKWNLRLNYMEKIGTVIDSIVDHMAGEKQAQAKLMRRYIERRKPFLEKGNRRWGHGARIQDDRESLEMIKEFYKVRGNPYPKELAEVLNDYPEREYSRSRGEAPGALQGAKI